jgi:hypothetical protein
MEYLDNQFDDIAGETVLFDLGPVAPMQAELIRPCQLGLACRGKRFRHYQVCRTRFLG